MLIVSMLPDLIRILYNNTKLSLSTGRGGNVWISPEGCAMFSAHVRVDLMSNLGQRVAYLQHIASLAAVEAIRCKPGYEVRYIPSERNNRNVLLQAWS